LTTGEIPVDTTNNVPLTTGEIPVSTIVPLFDVMQKIDRTERNNYEDLDIENMDNINVPMTDQPIETTSTTIEQDLPNQQNIQNTIPPVETFPTQPEINTPPPVETFPTQPEINTTPPVGTFQNSENNFPTQPEINTPPPVETFPTQPEIITTPPVGTFQNSENSFSTQQGINTTPPVGTFPNSENSFSTQQGINTTPPVGSFPNSMEQGLQAQQGINTTPPVGSFPNSMEQGLQAQQGINTPPVGSFQNSGENSTEQGLQAQQGINVQPLDANRQQQVQKKNGSSSQGSDSDFSFHSEGGGKENRYSFLKRLQDSEKGDGYVDKVFSDQEGYSRKCLKPHQPVVLDEEEKAMIDSKDAAMGPGNKSYTEAMEYRNKYFICPLYWNFEENRSMTWDEVQKKGLQSKIMVSTKDMEKEIKEGRYIYFFKDKGQARAQVHPGFTLQKNSQGSCFPCCYPNNQLLDMDPITKKKLSSAAAAKRDTCLKTVALQKEKEEKEEQEEEKEESVPMVANGNKHFVLQENDFPLEPQRYGMLPSVLFDTMQLQHRLRRSDIPRKQPFLLRFGMEKMPQQSFLACMADIYTYAQDQHRNANTNQLIPPSPTMALGRFKKLLAEKITLDKFVQYQNGSLPSFFRPDNKKQIDYDVYKGSAFAKMLDMELERDFYRDTVDAYEHFRQYLLDTSITIDHHFLWDVFTSPNPEIIPQGINLIILNQEQDPMVHLVCPPNLYSSQSHFDPKKKSVLLLRRKKGNEWVYEPLYRVTRFKENGYMLERWFSSHEGSADMVAFLKQAEQLLKQCSGDLNQPRNLLLMSTEEWLHRLKQHSFHVHAQIVQAHYCIGFKISKLPHIEPFFVPCVRSALVENLEQLPVKERTQYAKDYTNTLKRLAAISKEFKLPALRPKQKIVDRSKQEIVGFVLENELYIPVEPPAPMANILDKLPVKYSIDFFEADAQIFSNKQDEERMKSNLFQLESDFYRLFMFQLRQKLNQRSNASVRKELLKLLEPRQEETTQVRSKKIQELLKSVAQEYATFKNIEPSSLYHLANIRTCQDAQKQPLCIMTKDGSQKFMFPTTNLVDSGVNNESHYFARLANEMMQNQRIRRVMLQPKLLFFQDTSQSIEKTDSELIVLESELKPLFDSVTDFTSSHPGYFRYR
jgi:hypothetical protein